MGPQVGLTDFTPKWLEIPATLATDTQNQTGPHLFRALATATGLNWPQTKAGIRILNLFQHSTDILEGICGHDNMANKVQLHKVFGDEKAAVWSFGLAFHVHEYIRDALEPALAFQVVRLLSRVAMLKLEGQHHELEARRSNSTDYKRTARLLTAQSGICLPVALLTLFKTGNLAEAYLVLENEALLEFGCWFHAERDLVENFELSRPRNTEIMNYTVFVDMVKERLSNGELSFPKCPPKVKELLDDHEIFYEYVVERENVIKRIEAEVAGASPEELLQDVVLHTKKLAVDHFRSACQLDAYACKLPDMRGLEYHPKSKEINAKFHAWVKSFPPSNPIYQFVFQDDFNEWANYSYSFIEDVDSIVQIHKMCPLLVTMDDMMEKSTHLIEDARAVILDCSQPGFLEGTVDHRPIVWSDPDWPLLPSIDFILKETIKNAKQLQQPEMLGDCKLFHKIYMWLGSVSYIRELVAHGNYTVEEQDLIRSHDGENFLWSAMGAAWAKKDFTIDYGYYYTTTYNFCSYLENEITSYGTDIINDKALPKRLRGDRLIGTIDYYVRHGERVQDAVFRMNKVETEIVEWLFSFKGTDMYYMSIIFWGYGYHAYMDRYSRSTHRSKRTAICLMY